MKSCLNVGGPPSKPKYSSVTDSAPVPGGKGEKHPDEGSETDLKPDAYKQSELPMSSDGWSDGVPFV